MPGHQFHEAAIVFVEGAKRADPCHEKPGQSAQPGLHDGEDGGGLRRLGPSATRQFSESPGQIVDDLELARLHHSPQWPSGLFRTG